MTQTIARRRPDPRAVVVHHDAERNTYQKQRAVAAELSRTLAIVDDEGFIIATSNPLPDVESDSEDNE
jgi:inosine/xanthosine triphosphate pyrophosphatase family protein